MKKYIKFLSLVVFSFLVISKNVNASGWSTIVSDCKQIGNELACNIDVNVHNNNSYNVASVNFEVLNLKVDSITTSDSWYVESIGDMF